MGKDNEIPKCMILDINESKNTQSLKNTGAFRVIQSSSGTNFVNKSMKVIISKTLQKI